MTITSYTTHWHNRDNVTVVAMRGITINGTVMLDFHGEGNQVHLNCRAKAGSAKPKKQRKQTNPKHNRQPRLNYATFAGRTH